MDFARYPVDVQECNVVLESYSTTSNVLKLRWVGLDIDPTITLNQYDFEIRHYEEDREYTTGEECSSCVAGHLL